MKPLQLQFPEPDRGGTHFLRLVLVLAIGVAVIMTALNGVALFSLARQRAVLETRHQQIRPPAAPRGRAARTPSAPREKEAVQRRFDALKPILEQDLFPLSQLLDLVELARPDSIVLNELRVTDQSATLVLKGASARAADVSRFLTALKLSQRFTIDLSRGAVSGDRGFSFEITAHEKPSMRNKK